MKYPVLFAIGAALCTGTALAQNAAQPSKDERPARRFGAEKPAPRTPGALRVATYNIENLFDDADDPALSGRYEDKDMTKPLDDMKAAATAIRSLDADVLALQEIESKEALLWFRDAHLSGMGYDHVVSIDAGDERGIEQAVLSRFPIVESKNWVRLELGGVHPEKWGNNENFNAGKPIVYHRSPLLVTVEVPKPETTGVDGAARTQRPPYQVTLVVVHHKAGREGEYWREKEAAKTVELLAAMQKEDPDRNIIWLGDFNATLADPSMRLVTQAGWYDVFAEKQKKAIDPATPPNERRNDPLIISHASGRIIDHVLLNPAARHEFIADSAFVLGTSMRGRDGYASDHYPVAIDLMPTDLKTGD